MDSVNLMMSFLIAKFIIKDLKMYAQTVIMKVFYLKKELTARKPMRLQTVQSILMKIHAHNAKINTF